MDEAGLLQALADDPLLLSPWLELLRRRSVGANDAANVDQMNALNQTFELALTHLPKSYKLWKMYLDARIVQVDALKISNPKFMLKLFDRVLDVMPKMPLMWLRYAEFTEKYRWLTVTRVVYLRALRALPVTQHKQIWTQLRAFLQQPYVPTTVVRTLLPQYLLFANNYRGYLEAIQLTATREMPGELLNQAAALVSEYPQMVTDDPQFWETVAMTLQGLDPDTSEDFAVLQPEKATKLVQTGCDHAPTGAVSLRVALAVFLMNRGDFVGARAALTAATDGAADAFAFFDAMVARSEFEYNVLTQLIATATDDSTETEADKIQAKYAAMHSEVYPDAATLEEAVVSVEAAISDYQLAYNHTMLKTEPTFVAHWLKRAELTNERMLAKAVSRGVGSSGSGTQLESAEEKQERIVAVVDVFKQAVHTCTSQETNGKAPAVAEANDGVTEESIVTARKTPIAASYRLGLPVLPVTEIYFAWATFLEDEGRHDAAKAALLDGALEGNLPNGIDDNGVLFMNLLERTVAKGQPFSEIRALVDRVTNVPNRKKKRAELFSREAKYVDLYRSERVWDASIDAFRSARDATIADVDWLFEKMQRTGTYTPAYAIEYAKLIAAKLHSAGSKTKQHLPQKIFDAAFIDFGNDPVALLQLYGACLVLEDDEQQRRVERLANGEASENGGDAAATPVHVLLSLERRREIYEDAFAAISGRKLLAPGTGGIAASHRANVQRLALGLFRRASTMEEREGLAQFAVEVAKRAVEVIPAGAIHNEACDWCIEVVDSLLGASAAAAYGISHLQQLVTQRQSPAVSARVASLSVRCAQLEARAGEPTRARALYTQCAQLLPPSKFVDFWNTWEEFELSEHGNATTLRDLEATRKATIVRHSDTNGETTESA